MCLLSLVVSPVVLSPSSTLSLVITQYFYRDKSASSFEDGTVLSCSFMAYFTEIITLIMYILVHMAAICALRYIFLCVGAHACSNGKRKINGLLVCYVSEWCIQCADLPNERQKLFTSVSWAGRLQLLLDISGGQSSTQRLKTSGLLASLNSMAAAHWYRSDALLLCYGGRSPYLTLPLQENWALYVCSITYF